MATQACAPSTPATILQLTWGYAPTLIVETAIRMGLFDLLDAGPLNLAELCRQTGGSSRGLRAVINVLLALGLVEVTSPERFQLSPVSRSLLVSHKPDFQGGLLRETSTRILPTWMHLEEAVRTGLPVLSTNREHEGAPLFHGSVAHLFALSYPSTQVLAWALKLPRLRRPVRVLDVAAGSGVWGIGLAKASVQIHVTAVDWEQVLSITRETAVRNGVADRMSFLPGDIQAISFGQDYDIATLGGILHSEGAEHSRNLLKKVFSALRPGGTIAISEFLVNNEHTAPLISAIFAVTMLLQTENGDVFSFDEISGWLSAAGFRNIRLLQVPAPSPLILADRPD